MTTLTTPLSRKSVLCAVSVSQWTARKFDKKVTDKLLSESGARADAARVNKLIIATEHLAEITSLVSQARALHYKMTLPWADDGPRILSNMLYQQFCNEFRVLKQKFEVAADVFAAGYPGFVAERKVALNGLYKDEDYPAPDTIREKFKLDYKISVFPDAADFRSDLDDDTVAEIRERLQTTTTTVVDEAMKHTVERIVATVGHMAKKLGEYKPGGNGEKTEGVFRDSLVDNVRELAALLPAFNLTGDPALAAIATRISKELCVEEAADLREHEDVRAEVAKSAEDIVAAVQGLFG